ncbi:peroxisomal membrane protein 11B-like [Lineus longissimus]|uniref:peroxisomal membrane protein 11B-like n=1 Tax=Lineus longissimus TaxID=88925 RepID=UPI002B4D6D73
MEILSDVAKFNAQTAGRDKFCRLVQYSSKLTWWYFEKVDKDKEWIKTLKNLESVISSTRKLLRFGKSLDLLQASLRSLHIGDIVFRLTITLSKITQGLYLLVDHAIWLSRVGLLKMDAKKLNETAARFWITTIIMGLTRDVYEILTILNQQYKTREKRKMRSQYTNGVANQTFVTRPTMSHTELFGKFVVENKPLLLDTAKNGADLFLPMSTLGYIKVSPGFQGVCGIISSLVGILTVWNSGYRLVPS